VGLCQGIGWFGLSFGADLHLGSGELSCVFMYPWALEASRGIMQSGVLKVLWFGISVT
jgi:hypothetical protein